MTGLVRQPTSAGTRAAPVPAGRPLRRAREGRYALALLTPALVVVFGIILYPLGRTLVLSFLDADSVVEAAYGFVGVRNYADLVTDPAFWQTVGRTAVFTVFSTGIELVVGVLLAQFLNQRIPGQWLFRTAVIVVWAVPTIVNANMWRWILNPNYGALNGLLLRLGLIDHYQDWIGGPGRALYVVAVVDAWKTIPLVAILLLAGMQTIPADIYEAAAIDGAGALRRFRHMTLPLLKPVIAVVIVLRTIEAFKVFDIIYIMTRGGPASGTTTIAFYAYLQAFSNQRFGLGSAIAFLTALFILALSLVYLRALRQTGSGR
ncbi:sugar ABC transporter permease [Microbispora corallina]|uniref:ABC transporter permease n=1 Tax=Microbispora corallina TaxID=83302 RepID=A0ABQ4FZF4_9ACTN|nr:sugar ABC transporter permease [Microbispora corallina]GIH40187.1 ABC transporter permease [Microbispora corallina]